MLTPQDLRLHLARYGTASAALVAWCMERSTHAGPLRAVVAQEGAMQDGPLRHRRVTLCWDDTVLSQADNWYLPERLPPDVAASLLAGDVPFGTLLMPHAVQRRTVGEPATTGDFILGMEAVLSLPGRGDIAFVRERYHRNLLEMGHRPAK